jgi:hypothetical protein
MEKEIQLITLFVIIILLSLGVYAILNDLDKCEKYNWVMIWWRCVSNKYIIDYK